MKKRYHILGKIERSVILGALLIVIVFVLILGISTAISLFTFIVASVFHGVADCVSHATFATLC